MRIKPGDRLPDVTVHIAGPDGPQAVSTTELFGGKKVVLFAVPGAFTPTCTARHLPGYVDRHHAFTAKGVDAVYCLSVNDAFVMGAWGAAQNAADKVTLIGDGDGDFTRAVGLEFDLRGKGLGVRSQRYAMLIDNGVVTHLDVDEGGGLDVSSADAQLAKL